MVAMKRKRPGDGYDEDEKLLHQAAKTLAKEAKRVRTFLLQQAIRKSKMTAEKLAARSKSSKHRYRDAVPATASAAADKSAPTLPPVGSAATAAEHAAGGKHSGVAANAEATTDGDDEDEDRGSDGDGGRASGDDSDVEAVCSSTRDGALKPPPSEAVQNGAAARIAEEITTIKALQPEAAVKICLRRLGLRHTGPAGEAEVQVEGSARLKELVFQIVEHKRVITVMEELQQK
ncbi:unnamed protein product [Sphacelaria rigidula]